MTISVDITGPASLLEFFLLKNCAEWTDRYAVLDADAVGGANQNLLERQHEALTDIVDMPAVTPAGWVAKARILALLDFDRRDLAASLCADLEAIKVAEDTPS